MDGGRTVRKPVQVQGGCMNPTQRFKPTTFLLRVDSQPNTAESPVSWKAINVGRYKNVPSQANDHLVECLTLQSVYPFLLFHKELVQKAILRIFQSVPVLFIGWRHASAMCHYLG